MHLFIELVTLAFFLVCVAHAVVRQGREGLWFFGALLTLGFLRENFVALYRILYEFAPLSLMLGAAPLIGTIIWGYSIYLAVVWAEGILDRPRARLREGPMLGLVCLFMMALACFYEPFLARIGMARWEEGTRMVLGVPLIALVGYPSLAALFLIAYGFVRKRGFQGARRAAALGACLLPIALVHAAGLQELKKVLGW